MTSSASSNRNASNSNTSTDEPKSTSISKSKSSVKQVSTVVIVIGMAGTGKSTLVQRICAHVSQHKTPSYILNLDPAVSKGVLPYSPNIDIRDTLS